MAPGGSPWGRRRARWMSSAPFSLESFPGIDALRANGRAMAASPADAAQILGEHSGESAGPPRKHGYRRACRYRVRRESDSVFEHVIIVGASEGLLPPVRGDDPLLPDAARILFGGPEDVPTTHDSERSYGDTLRALANSSETVVAFFSRGTLPGRAVGLPSRYLGKTEVARIDSATLQPHRVAAARHR